jgi:polar amino acid transport system substrate-binding protein
MVARSLNYMPRVPIVAATLAFLGVMLLGVTIAWVQSPEQTWARVQRRGIIRVGYAPEQPFAFRDPTDRVTGESPEVARTLFSGMGIGSIEWVQTQWDDLIPELKAGRFDMIAIGMFITCERAQQISFTEPTFVLEQAFLVQAGNPKQLHSYENVRDRHDVRLAVVAGAQEQTLARTMAIPDSRVLAVPDAQTGTVAVRQGQVDALALTRPSIRAQVAEAEPNTVELAMPFVQPQTAGIKVPMYGAFGLRHEDTTLREALNKQLRQFVGTAAHQQLVAPFGFTANDLPRNVSTASLLDTCEKP